MYEINIDQSHFEQASGQDEHGFQKGLYSSWDMLTRANETNSVGTSKDKDEITRGENLYQFNEALRGASDHLTLDKVRKLLAEQYDCKTKEKQDRVIAFILQDRGGFAWIPAFTLGGVVFSIGDTVFQLDSEEAAGFKLIKGQNPGDVCFVYDKDLNIQVLNKTTQEYKNLKVKLQYQLNVNDDGTFNTSPLKIQFEETPLFNQQIKPKLEKQFAPKLAKASGPKMLLPLALYYLISTLVFLASPPVGILLYSLPVIGLGLKKLADWVSQSPQKTVDASAKVSKPDRGLDSPVEDRTASSYKRVLEMQEENKPKEQEQEELSNSADTGYESFPALSPEQESKAPKQGNNRRSTLRTAALSHKSGPKDSDLRHSIRRTQ